MSLQVGLAGDPLRGGLPAAPRRDGGARGRAVGSVGGAARREGPRPHGPRRTFPLAAGVPGAGFGAGELSSAPRRHPAGLHVSAPRASPPPPPAPPPPLSPIL